MSIGSLFYCTATTSNAKAYSLTQSFANQLACLQELLIGSTFSLIRTGTTKKKEKKKKTKKKKKESTFKLYLL